jgi:hypothetical protein
MPVWPKSFYTFGVSLKTAATEWKLRKNRSAPAAQKRALGELLPRLATTIYWKQVGLEASLPYPQLRTRVPLSTYEKLAPAIARMQNGEADVLWPGTCSLFARTAGTTTGTPKDIPVTEEMLTHIRRAGLDALLYYTVRVKHAGAFRGRHLLCGGSTELVPVSKDEARPAYAGELSGIAGLTLPAWVEKHLYEPGVSVGRLTDWDARTAALIAKCSSCDITLIAGVPNWITHLSYQLRDHISAGKKRVSHLQGHWTNLECLVHTGIPIAPFAPELRTLLGPTLHFHEVYAATEGLIAAQDGDAARGLRLMADMGIFFEFLRMSDFDEPRIEQLGGKAVPLEGVETGVDYAVIVTTPAGLVRYVLGDVVRFLSTAPPRLIHVGGTALRLNTLGENVTEREVTAALVALCRKQNWTIVNFHVSHQMEAGKISRNQRGRHEWWVELRPGTISTPTGPQMATELDALVQQANERYAQLRQSGLLDAPVVRLVMPGVFEHWLRFHQRWGGQYKVARCRNDRLIADDLAKMTHFAHD